MNIVITDTPPGFAPEHIREAWIGVEIPLATEDELERDPPVGSFGTGENLGGFIVVFDKAVDALRQAGKDEAAEFWESFKVESGFGSFLEFKKDVRNKVID